MQLLQTDVEGFELAVIPVQWDDLKQPVVQTQADHTTLRIHDPDDPGLRRTADAILTQTQRSDAGGVCVCVFGQLCASRAYLHVSVGAGDDVDAVSVLLVLQDTGVVFSGQDE